MMRLLLLVVMLLDLLHILTLFVLVGRVTVVILMELLKILRSLTDHHASARVVTAASAFCLVRERHVFVILLGYRRVGVIRRSFHELVLRIQYINVL